MLISVIILKHTHQRSLHPLFFCPYVIENINLVKFVCHNVNYFSEFTWSCINARIPRYKFALPCNFHWLKILTILKALQHARLLRLLATNILITPYFSSLLDSILMQQFNLILPSGRSLGENSINVCLKWISHSGSKSAYMYMM